MQLSVYLPKISRISVAPHSTIQEYYYETDILTVKDNLQISKY